MKKPILTFLIVLFTLTSNVVWSANYNQGLTAYNNGDYATALLEWKPLAEQGNADAQYNLGVMYYKGQGVIQDNVYAHMWFNIAASAREKYATKDRDVIEKKMTPADISTAQKLARECVKKNYKGC